MRQIKAMIAVFGVKQQSENAVIEYQNQRSGIISIRTKEAFL